MKAYVNLCKIIDKCGQLLQILNPLLITAANEVKVYQNTH